MARANLKQERFGYRRWKRLLDVISSALLLLFLWLPMLGIALLIRLTSPGPAIFRQTRVGREGRLFTCYKFRTMLREAPRDRPTAQFVDAERYITPIGRLLRKSSLDELPQLWNVLRGDMSLVGPRPLIPSERTVHRLRRRSGVYGLRPGITGLAQVNGRDLLSDRRKAALDIQYASRLSLTEDLRILWKTLGGILLARGISEGSESKL